VGKKPKPFFRPKGGPPTINECQPPVVKPWGQNKWEKESKLFRGKSKRVKPGPLGKNWGLTLGRKVSPQKIKGIMRCEKGNQTPCNVPKTPPQIVKCPPWERAKGKELKGKKLGEKKV